MVLFLGYFYIAPFIFLFWIKKYMESKRRTSVLFLMLIGFPVLHILLSWQLVPLLGVTGAFAVYLIMFLGGFLWLLIPYYLVVILLVFNKSKIIAILALLIFIIFFYFFARFRANPPDFLKKDQVTELRKEVRYSIQADKVIKD